MLDFERLFDQLRLYLARTPEEKARAEGYIQGKKYARKEMACCFGFLLFVCLMIVALCI